MKLDSFDLSLCIARMPQQLRTIMKNEHYRGRVFVGGGFIRACVAGEELNDIDIFVPTVGIGGQLTTFLSERGILSTAPELAVFETENATTILSKPVPMQVIHRWTFDRPEDVAQSFDFTVCCAVIYVNEEGNFDSFIDDRFYVDLASKRLVYRSPERNEDAGGSMLRVLKYYQRGYRIPLDSLGFVMARMCTGINWNNISETSGPVFEADIAKQLTGLLREVDPNVDPTHTAHVPSLAF